MVVNNHGESWVGPKAVWNLQMCLFMFLSKLDQREYRKCPQLHVSIWLALDTVFKMSSLQWKTSEIYKCVCVCFYDRPFTFYAGVYSGFSRKERWKRAAWSSWHWGEYCVIWDLKIKVKEPQIRLLSDVTVISSFRGRLVYLDSGGWRVTQGWMVPQD